VLLLLLLLLYSGLCSSSSNSTYRLAVGLHAPNQRLGFWLRRQARLQVLKQLEQRQSAVLLARRRQQLQRAFLACGVLHSLSDSAMHDSAVIAVQYGGRSCNGGYAW
jgi:hypothetical protein